MIFTLIFLLVPFSAQAAQTKGVHQTSKLMDCEANLLDLENSDTLLQQLSNPVISSKEELNKAISWAVDFQNCLNQIAPADKNKRQELAEVYNQIFLIFSSALDTPPGDTQLELVELNSVDDPAVRILREQVGIPPAPGYIFVRSYASRQAMPPVIRSAFSDPNVAGVTILNRYIAILVEKPESWVEKALQNQAIPATRSHELVHAYIGAATTPNFEENGTPLPKWFEEGLATFLTKGSKPHSVITPNLSITTTASTEYQRYEQVFKYMQHRLGKEMLYQSIGKVVLEDDINLIFSDLSIPNEVWLFANTQEWQRDRAIRSTWISLAGIVVLFGALYMSLPEYQCICGYSGRKKNFSSGVCENCGRPVDIAIKIRGAQKFVFLPSCQVCRKRFWPWQRDQLQIHRFHVKAWQTGALPDDPPKALYVNRICINCLARSQQCFLDYQHQINDEIQKVKGGMRLMVEHWLDDAPVLDITDADAVYQHSEVDVDDIVNAALAQQFGEWSMIDSEFEFDPPFPPLTTNIELHYGYTNVFRRLTDGANGALFALGNDRYWIVWNF